MKKLVPVLILSCSAQGFAATQAVTSIQMKIYGVWAAQNADCSNPVLIFQNDSPSLQNLTANPSLGGGDIPDGTYRCIILKVSSFLTVGYSGGTCQANIFAPGSYNFGGAVDNKCDAIDDPVNGASISTSNSEQIVYLYLGTSGTANGPIFSKGTTTNLVGPNAPAHGTELLANPFVVSGSSAGKFIVKNLTKVDPASGCALDTTNPSDTIWDFK